MTTQKIQKLAKKTTKALDEFNQAIKNENLSKDQMENRIRKEAESSVYIEYPKEDLYYGNTQQKTRVSV